MQVDGLGCGVPALGEVLQHLVKLGRGHVDAALQLLARVFRDCEQGAARSHKGLVKNLQSGLRSAGSHGRLQRLRKVDQVCLAALQQAERPCTRIGRSDAIQISVKLGELAGIVLMTVLGASGLQWMPDITSITIVAPSAKAATQ